MYSCVLCTRGALTQNDVSNCRSFAIHFAKLFGVLLKWLPLHENYKVKLNLHTVRLIRSNWSLKSQVGYLDISISPVVGCDWTNGNRNYTRGFQYEWMYLTALSVSKKSFPHGGSTPPDPFNNLPLISIILGTIIRTIDGKYPDKSFHGRFQTHSSTNGRFILILKNFTK